MNNLLKFHYEDIDGFNTGNDILVVVESKEPIDKNIITDCISSYIDTVEDWGFEQLINDVLTSFGYEYHIICPMTFVI